jgi:formate dehydrogenase iron-sulfur subunit
VTTRDLPAMWKHVGMAAASLVAMVAGALIGRRA